MKIKYSIFAMLIFTSGCIIPAPIPHVQKGTLHPQVVKVYRASDETLVLESYGKEWATIAISDLTPIDRNRIERIKMNEGFTITHKDFRTSNASDLIPEGSELLKINHYAKLIVNTDQDSDMIFSRVILGGQMLIVKVGSGEDLRVVLIEQKHKKHMKVGVPVIYPDVTDGGVDIGIFPR